MIETDIKNIVTAFKPNLFFSEQLPDPKDSFPVLNFFVREIVETTGQNPQSRISFEMRIFAPFPSTCKTFDEAILQTKDEVDGYRRWLRTFINYLITYYGYSSRPNDQFTYRVYPHQVTENNYVAVTVTGFLYEKGPFNCCDELFFDTGLLPSKGWGTL